MEQDKDLELKSKSRFSVIVLLLAGILLFVAGVAIGVLLAAVRSGNGSTGNPYNSQRVVSDNMSETVIATEKLESMIPTIPSVPEVPETVGQDIVAGHLFREKKDTVTAKEATNLRDIPSQGEESLVMLTLQNGQLAERIAVSDSGWSRVVYNGETYYAVSSLLTTDLTTKPEPVQQPDDGIDTEFIACDEMVSPKIEVNLRTIPSVTDPNSKVVVTAKYGEVFKRTGINNDVGWSRVEYNGQTLYCVSSYVYIHEVVAE